VNKYTRLGKSYLMMLTLHFLSAATLIGVWILTIDDPLVIDLLLKPEYKDTSFEVNAEYAGEIELFVYLAFVKLVLWSVAFSFLWLSYSSLVPIEQPGQAKSMGWFWWLLLVSGLFGAFGIFGLHFMELTDFGGQTDLLALDMRMPMATGWVFLFLILYAVCGTFFTTTRIARPAVPLASRVLRN
jgi:hypothetical protein